MIRQGQGPQQNPLLLVGNGRLSKHLRFYFQNLQLPFQTWQRGDTRNLQQVAAPCERILLAVSDDALEGLVQELRPLQKPIVHFSGALSPEGALSAHPLMSFGPDLYAADFYPQIHFVITGAPRLDDLLPRLPNSFTEIPAEAKPLYHALCVLGGNFPVLLWNKMDSGLRALGLPPTASQIYIRQVLTNYFALGEKALTGPLVRKDTTTIAKNLAALGEDPWRQVYDSFQEALK